MRDLFEKHISTVAQAQKVRSQDLVAPRYESSNTQTRTPKLHGIGHIEESISSAVSPKPQSQHFVEPNTHIISNKSELKSILDISDQPDEIHHVQKPLKYYTWLEMFISTLSSTIMRITTLISTLTK
jgi:hypothetical protein